MRYILIDDWILLATPDIIRRYRDRHQPASNSAPLSGSKSKASPNLRRPQAGSA